jgi:hypothetical protein
MYIFQDEDVSCLITNAFFSPVENRISTNLLLHSLSQLFYRILLILGQNT